jgi:hypothetical protein
MKGMRILGFVDGNADLMVSFCSGLVIEKRQWTNGFHRLPNLVLPRRDWQNWRRTRRRSQTSLSKL